MAELLLALGLLGIFLVLGIVQFSGGLDRQQARSGAQAAQAAIAWAQTGVVWHGGVRQVSMDEQGLTLSEDDGGLGADARKLAPSAPVTSNVSRWNIPDGVAIRLLYPLASPNSAGSLYFGGEDPVYRVIVRAESGLTVRRSVY